MITKIELRNLLNKLDNAVDKFIVAGLFYGLNESDNREQLLSIKSASVDLENSTLTLPNGRVVVMDQLLKKITVEAMAQKVYRKMGTIAKTTNEDYEFNPASEYIIKVRPTARNNNGTEPLTNAGFKTRIRAISEFLVGDTSLTPNILKTSGAFSLLQEKNKSWTVREAEAFLKENGLSLRRNNLMELLKKL